MINNNNKNIKIKKCILTSKEKELKIGKGNNAERKHSNRTANIYKTKRDAV